MAGVVSMFATLAHAQPVSDQPPYGIPKSAPTAPQPDFGGEQRHDVMAGFELTLGQIFTAEGHLGYMITPHVAALVSASAFATPSDDCANGGTTLMVGMRFWYERLFLDGRVGRLTHEVTCDGDFEGDPQTKTTHHYVAGQLGAGLDLAHYDHMGFELHISGLIADNAAAFTAGLGLTLYLP